jgi:hypothetical protein
VIQAKAIEHFAVDRVDREGVWSLFESAFDGDPGVKEGNAANCRAGRIQIGDDIARQMLGDAERDPVRTGGEGKWWRRRCEGAVTVSDCDGEFLPC